MDAGAPAQATACRCGAEAACPANGLRAADRERKPCRARNPCSNNGEQKAKVQAENRGFLGISRQFRDRGTHRPLSVGREPAPANPPSPHMTPRCPQPRPRPAITVAAATVRAERGSRLLPPTRRRPARRRGAANLGLALRSRARQRRSAPSGAPALPSPRQRKPSTRHPRGRCALPLCRGHHETWIPAFPRVLKTRTDPALTDFAPIPRKEAA